MLVVGSNPLLANEMVSQQGDIGVGGEDARFKNSTAAEARAWPVAGFRKSAEKGGDGGASSAQLVPVIADVLAAVKLPTCYGRLS
jgi:hypothetical protein